MKPWSHAAESEEHDSEKAGLKKERGQDFERNHWTYDWACDLSEVCESQPEFKGKHNASNHADTERHGEKAEPEAVDLQVDGVPGLQPQSFHHGKEHRQADGRGREDDVEAHREGELHASEHRRIQVHDRPPSSGARPMMTPAVSIARARPPIATHKPNTPMMAKKKAMPITTVVSTPATFRETLDFGCDICHRPPSPVFADAKKPFPSSFYIPRSQLMTTALPVQRNIRPCVLE